MQLCPQRGPVHQAATVTMRCLAMRSWASRLLLLHSVNLFLSCSFISVWIRFCHYFCFSISLFLSSPLLSHPLSLSILSTIPYPVSPTLPAVIRPLASTLCVSAGMKTTVSEAEHPLLCEGTRRVKGDLALALMITYKDDQSKLKKVAITTLIILTI